MLESKFQADLIRELKEIFPGAIVLKNDPGYRQGFPDLIILVNDKWAVLECKRSATAARQPNQEYYILTTNEMSFGAFIHPDNKEEVLRELQHSFQL